MAKSSKYERPMQEIVVSGLLEGRVQPHDDILEKQVIGIALDKMEFFDMIAEMLPRASMFYNTAHQVIYKAMLKLREENSVVDMLTVSLELAKSGRIEDVGGRHYIIKCHDTVVSSAGIADHCRKIIEFWMSRQMIHVAGNLLHHAYRGEIDVFELRDFAEAALMDIAAPTKAEYHSISDTLPSTMQRIAALRHADQELTGVDTGFAALNALTGGWQKPDLIIVAARPSVGKTALSLNFASAAAAAGTAVGFFSLEMSEVQLHERLLSSGSKVPLASVSRGKLSDDQWKLLEKKGYDPLMKTPIFIDDTSGLNIFDLKAKVRRMVRRDGVGLIIIDYLQLMSGISNKRDQNREQEISLISRELKNTAKELGVPIIALAQLSRDVEKRQGKKMPVLADLRESGAIEQDADIVMFLYRPEYYGETIDENNNALNGETHVRFAKHRSGALDTIKLRAVLAIQKFYDMDDVPVQKGLTPILPLQVEDPFPPKNASHSLDEETTLFGNVD